jgi:hypothetical protein
MKPAFRFSLRSLLLAITLWSVLLMGFIQWGMVEALDLVLLVVGPLILGAHLHREVAVRRRVISGALAVLHVLATVAAVVFAYLATRGDGGWLGVLIWTIAGVLMFPLALIHHFVCRYCGWHSGLAQPGTFLLVVVLNTLLWDHVWRWRRAKRLPPGTESASGSCGTP